MSFRKVFIRTISLLKLDNFDKDLFKQRTKKIMKI